LSKQWFVNLSGFHPESGKEFFACLPFYLNTITLGNIIFNFTKKNKKMCENCGCSDYSSIRIVGKADDHSHPHPHSHDHGHDHYHNHHDGDFNVKELFKQNKLQAERNRGIFEAKQIFAIKIFSSQGSGKSALIEKAIGKLLKNNAVFVIQDDQKTTIDSDKMLALGAKSVNINTGNLHHLNAEMVYKAIKTMDIKDKSLLFIENHANISYPEGCPDLGETRNVVVIGVTEGDNFPLKYPELFVGANICIINKKDLLPYVDFDIDKVKKSILTINPSVRFIETSAKTGEGIDEWAGWLTDESAQLS
jgi:hydrogenase nickel incorporation protein HypB